MIIATVVAATLALVPAATSDQPIPPGLSGSTGTSASYDGTGPVETYRESLDLRRAPGALRSPARMAGFSPWVCSRSGRARVCQATRTRGQMTVRVMHLARTGSRTTTTVVSASAPRD